MSKIHNQNKISVKREYEKCVFVCIDYVSAQLIKDLEEIGELAIESLSFLKQKEEVNDASLHSEVNYENG